MKEDEIKEESRRHDCPIGGISLHVLTKEEADREDKAELVKKGITNTPTHKGVSTEQSEGGKDG